jgi:hypothetical protein
LVHNSDWYSRLLDYYLPNSTLRGERILTLPVHSLGTETSAPSSDIGSSVATSAMCCEVATTPCIKLFQRTRQASRAIKISQIKVILCRCPHVPVLPRVLATTDILTSRSDLSHKSIDCRTRIRTRSQKSKAHRRAHPEDVNFAPQELYRKKQAPLGMIPLVWGRES